MDFEFLTGITIIRASQATKSRTAGGVWLLIALAVAAMVGAGHFLPDASGRSLALLCLAVFFILLALAFDYDTTIRLEIDHQDGVLRLIAPGKYPMQGNVETFVIAGIDDLVSLPEGAQAANADTFNVALLLRDGAKVTLPMVRAPLDREARERQLELLRQIIRNRR